MSSNLKTITKHTPNTNLTGKKSLYESSDANVITVSQPHKEEKCKQLQSGLFDVLNRDCRKDCKHHISYSFLPTSERSHILRLKHWDSSEEILGKTS